MNIELKIDHGLLADEIVKRLKSDFVKHLGKMNVDKKTRWNKAEIREYFGCSISKFNQLMNHPKFPKGAGTVKFRTWDADEIRKFWKELAS